MARLPGSRAIHRPATEPGSGGSLISGGNGGGAGAGGGVGTTSGTLGGTSGSGDGAGMVWVIVNQLLWPAQGKRRSSVPSTSPSCPQRTHFVGAVRQPNEAAAATLMRETAFPNNADDVEVARRDAGPPTFRLPGDPWAITHFLVQQRPLCTEFMAQPTAPRLPPSDDAVRRKFLTRNRARGSW